MQENGLARQESGVQAFFTLKHEIKVFHCDSVRIHLYVHADDLYTNHSRQVAWAQRRALTLIPESLRLLHVSLQASGHPAWHTRRMQCVLGPGRPQNWAPKGGGRAAHD